MKPYRPPSEPHPIREKFAGARKELSSSLIERDEEVDLVLTALLANEHVLLVGPPGCGKSLLTRRGDELDECPPVLDPAHQVHLRRRGDGAGEPHRPPRPIATAVSPPVACPKPRCAALTKFGKRAVRSSTRS